jgi:hypothetical protein
VDVDSLAAAAEAASLNQASKKPGVVRLLPTRPGSLPVGRAMIIVIEGDAVAARTINRPAVSTVGPGETADSLARELANVSAILAERPEGGGALGALTEDEMALLNQSGVELPAAAREPGEDPVTQSIAAFARLVTQSLSVEDTAKRLRVQSSRIRQRLGGSTRTLYGFKLGNSWRVPPMQFAGKGTVPGLGPVVAALPRDLHPLEVVGWFTQPQADLENDADSAPLSPRDWLLGGRSPEAVAALARELEHGG